MFLTSDGSRRYQQRNQHDWLLQSERPVDGLVRGHRLVQVRGWSDDAVRPKATASIVIDRLLQSYVP